MARFAAVLWLGFLLAVGVLPAAAGPWQNLADPVFVRVDPRDLPEAAVMAVAQDSTGFLWIGTQGGLARYDGYHFRSFLPNATDPSALPDAYVRTLLPDADGGMWIGASSSGLIHYDAATERFRTWGPGRAGPNSAAVNAIALARDGGLWVGGDGGLDHFDPRTSHFQRTSLRPGDDQPLVWSILLDRAGALWVGTQAGLYERPAGSNRFRAIPLTGRARAIEPAIYSLYEDGGGRLWAGSVNAVYQVGPDRRVHVLASSQHDPATLAPGPQWSITEMSPGVLWIGTDAAISIVQMGSGHVHRVETDVQSPGGLTSGRVLQFFRDRSGGVWLANHVGGLLLYEPGTRGLDELSATRPEIGFNDKGALALAALSNQRLWVGGFFGRLALFDARSGGSTVFTVPNHAAIQVLRPRRDGSLWIGTTTGLCRLPAGASRVVCPAGPRELAGASIYAILEDGPWLWVGSSAGLLGLDRTTHRIVTYQRTTGPRALTNTQVRELFRDRRGRLWVGTENGLDRIDPDGRITRFTSAPNDPNSIGPGGVTSILEDRAGRMWVGAEGGPLNVMQEQPNGSYVFHHLGRDDGMPHENADGLGEDRSGRIWASTDRGLALIDPHSLRARGLGLADGVSQGAFWASAVSRASDGTMFFGGLDGITIVEPNATSVWTYAPPIVVTALQVGHKSIPTLAVNRGQGTVNLPADARDLTVEFAALDYTAPQALRYEYRLDGYDREWIDTDSSHRTATYTRLPPGNYTLELRATNRLGVWSVHELRVALHVEPAWYETWWFRAVLALFLLLLGYAAHAVRTAVLRRRQRELEELVRDRTRELSEANAKLEEMSLSDPLTGLRNRRFLTQHLGSDIALTLRRYEDWNVEAEFAEPPQDSDLLFFLVDLDNFKQVNDQYGHHAGDLVLMQMRERLQEVFRESDFVVRWGGDEFLAVARGSRRSEAGRIAARIREAVAERPFALGGQSSDSSASVGYAAFPFVQAAPNALTWVDVVGLADHALYMAKEAGRNTWFGLEATASTDPEALLRQLPNSASDAVDAGSLQVVSGEKVPGGSA